MIFQNLIAIRKEGQSIVTLKERSNNMYTISNRANTVITAIEELYKIKGGIIAAFRDELNENLVSALDELDACIMCLNNETNPKRKE